MHVKPIAHLVRLTPSFAGYDRHGGSPISRPRKYVGVQGSASSPELSPFVEVRSLAEAPQTLIRGSRISVAHAPSLPYFLAAYRYPSPLSQLRRWHAGERRRMPCGARVLDGRCLLAIEIYSWPELSPASMRCLLSRKVDVKVLASDRTISRESPLKTTAPPGVCLTAAAYTIWPQPQLATAPAISGPHAIHGAFARPRR
jgi:hypothetical protein